MDKMKKIDVNEKDPITYLNKKRDHKFFFISSWNVNKSEKGKHKFPKILKNIGLLLPPRSFRIWKWWRRPSTC